MIVLADTSALFAVLDADDKAHASATSFWEEELRRGTRFRITSYALLETWALVQHRLGLAVLCRFRGDILPAVDVEWVDQSLHEAGASMVMALGKRSLSLVDCTSFALMRQAGIKDVFAFDPHFAQQGFNLLPASGLGSGDAEGVEQ